MKMFTFIFSFISSFITLYGQIPTGYYNSAQGLTGSALKNALHNIIKNHNSVSYSSLHTHFQNTDKKSNNKVWDMYSDNPNGTPAYTFSFTSADQCGNYSTEGDCYNREHSLPKSWFNDATPMYTDLFHLYPTDGYVNGKKSNYPLGETTVPSWTSLNGSKLGGSTFSGYSGVVFEPIDAYKGDLARSYFYMMVRYKNVTSTWSSPMMTADTLKQWAVNLLVKWSNQDPVSQKEIDRNNAVYNIQNNRNPFIDHPEWIDSIWNSTLVGISEMKPEVSIVYFNGEIQINSDKVMTGNVIVQDVIGKVVNQFAFYKTKNIHHKFQLKNGIYIFKIQTDKNQLITKKVVVVQ